MPGGEPVLGPVRLGDRLVEAPHLADREERDEQLLPEERALERQQRDGGSDVMAAVEHPAREPRAAVQHHCPPARAWATARS